MNVLNIKYEDSDILLVRKPAGIATESRRIGEQDMRSMVRNYRAERGEPDYVGMVHRLDQPVGGLLLFAKTKEAAADLSGQIQDKTMEKYYQALVYGVIEEEGTLTDELAEDRKANRSRVVEKGTPGAKSASLKFRRLRVFSGEISLVEIRLLTGRRHQIRVQMAHHGFPLLGDRKYGSNGLLPPREAQIYEALQSENGVGKRTGPALFAWRLRFRHPKTGKWMDFTENPPWNFG